jgi:DNA-binding winged helix-turn-helix (wHTH) protein
VNEVLGSTVVLVRWPEEAAQLERLAEVLLSRYGEVATFEDLRGAGWPDGQVKRDVLRVRLTKLRETIEPLGLQIVGVRERGYVLQVRDEPPV